MTGKESGVTLIKKSVEVFFHRETSALNMRRSNGWQKNKEESQEKGNPEKSCKEESKEEGQEKGN